MVSRADLLLAAVDVAASRGLELGPLANPVVSRAQGDIRYIDHLDTDALRTRYASHDGFDVDAIVSIDYATGGRSIADAVADDAPFDYVVASHVVEHVPDPVGWFADIRAVLADRGVLALAVPDHRCCFDALRSPTVAAEVVEAHLRKATVPSPRQVFDHHAGAVAWRGAITWADEVPIDELVPMHSDREAFDAAAAVATTGAYHDVHCWVFTPRSFGAVVASLQRLGLIAFRVESCSDTVGGEFFVTLRADVADTATAAAGEHAPPTAAAGHRVGETALLRAQLRESQAAEAEVRHVLAAMRATRSWRAITAFHRVRSGVRRRSATLARRLRRAGAR